MKHEFEHAIATGKRSRNIPVAVAPHECEGIDDRST